MRILFFSPYFYPYTSGLTTYPFKILNYLSKNHQITILTFFPEQAKRVEGLTIKYIPFLFRLSKGFISPQSLMIFYKEAFKTDLIILNIPNFEGLPLAILGKLLNKNVVSLFHCQVKLDQNLINKIINFFLNASVFIQLLVSNKIIAYTKDYMNSLLMGKLFKNKIVITLPPVTKLKVNNQLLNKLLKEKGGDVWIGFAGRIAQEKGIKYLIKAIGKLHSHPELDSGSRNGSTLLTILSLPKDKFGITIIFAGPYGKKVAGEQKYFEEILSLLKEKKINYQFLGNLSNSQLGAFYKAIDLLVLPSVNQTEAFGMVQVEAMLAGTPVIASNLPGVRIPLQLTKMGILVKPENPNQITKAIFKILKNRIEYSNQKLIDQAQKNFDIKKVYKFYVDLIGEKN